MFILGNPRGYGKSALVAEFAHTRDVVCNKKGFPSGPVLFTDFKGIKSSDDAEKRILATIQPLFFRPLFQLFGRRGRHYFLPESVPDMN